MSGSVQALNPAGTVSVAASTTSQATALPPGGDVLLISNAGSDYAFIALGVAGVIAHGAPSPSVPVPAGQQLLITCPPPVTEAAVIMNTGTGTVFLTRGYGTQR